MVQTPLSKGQSNRMNGVAVKIAVRLEIREARAVTQL